MRPARYEPEDIWALHGRIGPVAEHIRAKNADIYTLPRWHPGADAFKSALTPFKF